MGSIKIGNTNISDVKIGNTQIQKVYLGTTLIWEKTLPLTAFTMDSTQYTSDVEACAVGSGGITFYHNGVGTYPVTSDTVYSDSIGTIFNGADYWYKTAGGTVILIASNGMVSNNQVC